MIRPGKDPCQPGPSGSASSPLPSGAAFQDMKDTLNTPLPLSEDPALTHLGPGRERTGRDLTALKRLYQLEPDLILIGQGRRLDRGPVGI